MDDYTATAQERTISFGRGGGNASGGRTDQRAEDMQEPDTSVLIWMELLLECKDDPDQS